MSIHLKKLLSEQQLIKKIQIHHEFAHIVLHDAYDNTEVHRELMQLLIEMYKSSTDFKKYFKKPRLNGPVLRLTLQSDNDDYHGDEILNILIQQAKNDLKDQGNNLNSVKNKTQWRFLLENDMLIESLILEGNVAKFSLKKEHNNIKNHIPIYLMLNSLLKSSPQLSIYFKKAIYPSQMPLGLILTEEGRTKTSSQLLEILKDSVNKTQTAKRRHFTLPLANGILIKAITLQDNQVKIIPNDEYKHDTLSFRKNLSKIYYTNADFQNKFKPISFNKEHTVTLTLKENHGFENAEQVHSALISYAKRPENTNLSQSLQQRMDNPTLPTPEENPSTFHDNKLLKIPSFSELNDFDSEYFLTDNFIYGNNDLIFRGKDNNTQPNKSVYTTSKYLAPKP